MDHSDIICKALEYATIFEPGYSFGYRQSEIRNLHFERHVKSNKEITVAHFIYRGKRKKQQIPIAQTVIIEGWDHPAWEWGQETRHESGTIYKTAKYSAFSHLN